MNHVVIKIFVIFGLFFLTLIAGILPYKIGNSDHGRVDRRKIILSYCNCFAGGVFLATSFLDLLPLIQEKFTAVFQESSSSTLFPVAEFTTCIGIFLVLVMEQVIHTYHGSSFFHGHGHGDLGAKEPLLSSRTHGQNSSDSFVTGTTGIRTITTNDQKEGSIRIYILVFALSLHSIFEGLAIGLIVELDQLAQLGLAVSIHKSVLAFSLGVSMVQHKMKISTIIKAALIFAIMAPIGILVGIGIINSSSRLGTNLASAILQGIANGTFIYVTFFEILQIELSRQGNKLLKVLFMIIGYSIVTGLLYYGEIIEKKS